MIRLARDVVLEETRMILNKRFVFVSFRKYGDIIFKWLSRSGDVWGYDMRNLSNCEESCELEFLGCHEESGFNN